MSFDLGVMGLGYVGLPLALEAVASGLSVLGYDVNMSLLDRLERGHSHVDGVSDTEVAEALSNGFEIAESPTGLADCDSNLICVPTPLSGGVPDLEMVKNAAAALAQNLREGQLVVLESTSYPGTTDDVVKPILEKGSGLIAGKGFALAYSPERLDPGNLSWGIRNTPKIVAGVNDDSTERAAAYYRKICDQVVVLSGTREAEMAKLLENTYRHVNIALVNEMAVFCNELGIDIWEAIRGASTKPFGYQPFYPGPGVGGHCIPIDPSYLSHAVRQLGYPFRFVELAQEINARMPAYVVDRVCRLLNDESKTVKGSRVLFIGVAYKADVSDTRGTPASDIARRLLELGARVSFSDPLVRDFSVDGTTLECLPDSIVAAQEADLTLILTAHTAFDIPGIAEAAKLVLDTRAVIPKGSGNLL